MQSKYRLSGDKRFSQIHQEGRSVANNLLVVRVLPNGLDHSRFGFMVSKRLGNAVTRNKVKRRLREVVRQASLSPGWDVIFIARRGAEKAKYPQLRHSAENLLRRTQLISTDSNRERTE